MPKYYYVLNHVLAPHRVLSQLLTTVLSLRTELRPQIVHNMRACKTSPHYDFYFFFYDRRLTQHVHAQLYYCILRTRLHPNHQLKRFISFYVIIIRISVIYILYKLRVYAMSVIIIGTFV